jgi:hypothetical protein
MIRMLSTHASSHTHILAHVLPVADEGERWHHPIVASIIQAETRDKVLVVEIATRGSKIRGHCPWVSSSGLQIGEDGTVRGTCFQD